MPPEQEKAPTNNRRHIPAEIVEQILCNLPIKSLVRFSCVSKSWSRMIFESDLIREHFSRRKKMVINPNCSDYLNTASVCPFSSISSSNQPMDFENLTDLICPFQGISPRSAVIRMASCDELWCVRLKDSLFIWNPSMNSYTKLPDPLTPPSPGVIGHQFVYGLGYDTVRYDCKILKVSKRSLTYSSDAELYSLRRDSWKKIQPFPGDADLDKEGVFVSGTLHWLIDQFCSNRPCRCIATFHISMERYGALAHPSYYPVPERGNDKLEMTSLRGMLCVYVNYYKDKKFVVWVMKKYGVYKSWTKMFDICYNNAIPYFSTTRGPFTLSPLYFYDTGEILIKVITGWSNREIFLYKDDESIPQKMVGPGRYSNTCDGFLYVESLISPVMYCGRPLRPLQLARKRHKST